MSGWWGLGCCCDACVECDTAVANYYIAYGDNNSGTFYRDTDSYNVGANTWSSVTDAPTPARRQSASCEIGGKGYFMGGNSNNAPVTYNLDNDEYAGGTDTWTSKTDMPSPERTSCGAFAISGIAYLCGGFGPSSGSAVLSDNDSYDPVGDSWTAKTDIPSPARRALCGAEIELLGYIFGGLDSAITRLADTDEYDPGGNSWANKTDLPAPARSAASALQMNCSAYLTGALGNPALPTRDTDKYDPDTWSAMTDYPTPARGEAAHGTNGCIGYISGCTPTGSSTPTRDHDEYDPDTWTNKTDIPLPARSAGRGYGV